MKTEEFIDAFVLKYRVLILYGRMSCVIVDLTDEGIITGESMK
jgi:hypothetical protein